MSQGTTGNLLPKGAAALGRLSPRKLAALMASAPAARVAVRDARWWLGAVWLAVSALLLAMVAHIVLVGALQHSRTQAVAYNDLRSSLANAVTPVGQLDFEGNLVALGTPVALISIPSLGLQEVVRQGTTGEILRGGPGHSVDSVMPGQAGTSILLGRQSSYGGPFGALQKLAPGAEISIVTGQGTSTYAVFGMRRGGDPLPDPLGKGEGRLQLVTADGPALLPTGVLYVDAQLTSTVMATPSAVMLASALLASQKPMAMNPDAWPGVFFSLQWLVATCLLVLWLRRRWGGWQTWIVGVPLVLALAVATADAFASALPNLL
ncbi:sortase domain-containing protein [Luethyella okanaganae]|uniref:Sortase domain-bontaining protein n=1 Tax=Luethyella okanaganae TaxID=69372 RepID=A0ABW1VH90_9MICO